MSDPTLILEAWIRMRGWYKYAMDRPPPPTRADIVTIALERVELYRSVPLMVQPIPVRMKPLHVDNSIPEDKEIAWEVLHI